MILHEDPNLKKTKSIDKGAKLRRPSLFRSKSASDDHNFNLNAGRILNAKKRSKNDLESVKDKLFDTPKEK